MMQASCTLVDVQAALLFLPLLGVSALLRKTLVFL
jgi:hypothetical protein